MFKPQPQQQQNQQMPTNESKRCRELWKTFERWHGGQRAAMEQSLQKIIEDARHNASQQSNNPSSALQRSKSGSSPSLDTIINNHHAAWKDRIRQEWNMRLSRHNLSEADWTDKTELEYLAVYNLFEGDDGFLSSLQPTIDSIMSPPPPPAPPAAVRTPAPVATPAPAPLLMQSTPEPVPSNTTPTATTSGANITNGTLGVSSPPSIAPSLSTGSHSSNISSTYTFVNPSNFGEPEEEEPALDLAAFTDDLLSDTSGNALWGWESDASGLNPWAEPISRSSARSSPTTSPEQHPLEFVEVKPPSHSKTTPGSRTIPLGGNANTKSKTSKGATKSAQSGTKKGKEKEVAPAEPPMAPAPAPAASAASAPPAPSTRHQQQASTSSSGSSIKEDDYLGPILVDESDDGMSEEEEYERYKMEIRIQKIKEYHAEAADADIALAQQLYQMQKYTSPAINTGGMSRKELNSDMSRMIQEHKKRMVVLGKAKDDERKSMVEMKRKAIRKALEERKSQNERTVRKLPTDVAAALAAASSGLVDSIQSHSAATMSVENDYNLLEKRGSSASAAASTSRDRKATIRASAFDQPISHASSSASGASSAAPTTPAVTLASILDSTPSSTSASAVASPAPAPSSYLNLSPYNAYDTYKAVYSSASATASRNASHTVSMSSTASSLKPSPAVSARPSMSSSASSSNSIPSNAMVVSSQTTAIVTRPAHSSSVSSNTMNGSVGSSQRQLDYWDMPKAPAAAPAALPVAPAPPAQIRHPQPISQPRQAVPKPAPALATMPLLPAVSNLARDAGMHERWIPSSGLENGNAGAATPRPRESAPSSSASSTYSSASSSINRDRDTPIKPPKPPTLSRRKGSGASPAPSTESSPALATLPPPAPTTQSSAPTNVTHTSTTAASSTIPAPVPSTQVSTSSAPASVAPTPAPAKAAPEQVRPPSWNTAQTTSTASAATPVTTSKQGAPAIWLPPPNTDSGTKSKVTTSSSSSSRPSMGSSGRRATTDALPTAPLNNTTSTSTSSSTVAASASSASAQMAKSMSTPEPKLVSRPTESEAKRSRRVSEPVVAPTPPAQPTASPKINGVGKSAMKTKGKASAKPVTIEEISDDESIYPGVEHLPSDAKFIMEPVSEVGHDSSASMLDHLSSGGLTDATDSGSNASKSKAGKTGGPTLEKQPADDKHTRWTPNTKTETPASKVPNGSAWTTKTASAEKGLKKTAKGK